MATKEQRKHFDRVARIGCILCKHQGNEGTPAELHHIRRTMPRSVAPVIPLCPYHHRGTSAGLHGMGRRAFERQHSITEEELLEMVQVILQS